MKQSVCAAIVACLALSGCGGKKRVSLPGGVRLGSAETGVASWYGNPYHGRRAANGEIYDMEQMTAAHRTLPFGTWVRVHNLDNNKNVEVRITDRGPFVGGRIVDLSHAAAVAIDMVGPGTAKVKLTIIAAPPSPPNAVVRAAAAPATPSPPNTVESAAQFAVQVGAFTDRGNAERVLSAMQLRFGSAKIVMRDGRPVQWRVLVGRAATQEDAEALAEKIRGDPAAGAAAAFVVRLDTETGADSL